MVSLFTAGACVGAFFAGYLGDWIGRRGTIASATVVFVLGGCIQSAAQSLSYLDGGRFTAGVG